MEYENPSVSGAIGIGVASLLTIQWTHEIFCLLSYDYLTNGGILTWVGAVVAGIIYYKYYCRPLYELGKDIIIGSTIFGLVLGFLSYYLFLIMLGDQVSSLQIAYSDIINGSDLDSATHLLFQLRARSLDFFCDFGPVFSLPLIVCFFGPFIFLAVVVPYGTAVLVGYIKEKIALKRDHDSISEDSPNSMNS